jgi:hypothetical protein
MHRLMRLLTMFRVCIYQQPSVYSVTAYLACVLMIRVQCWVQVHAWDLMAVATVWTHLDKLLYGQHGDTDNFVRCAWVWNLSFRP